MTKLLGCATLLAAALLLLRGDSLAHRRQLLTIRELQSALHNIATAVRWQQVPLPQAIAAQSGGPLTGDYFRKIVEDMRSEKTLQQLWKNCFSDLQEPLARILCSIQLRGDREDVLRQLEHGCSELKRCENELCTAERDRRKVLCASTLSGVSILMILLL